MNFKEYVRLWEDVDAEVAKIEQELAQVDSNINTQITPLRRKRDQLVKMLADKRKQLDQQRAKQSNTKQTDTTTMQPSSSSSSSSSGASITGIL